MPKPTPFEVDQLLQRDKLLRAPLSLYGPFPGFPTSKSAKETDFQSLAKAIVSQQLSSSAANTIYLNLHIPLDQLLLLINCQYTRPD